MLFGLCLTIDAPKDRTPEPQGIVQYLHKLGAVIRAFNVAGEVSQKWEPRPW